MFVPCSNAGFCSPGGVGAICVACLEGTTTEYPMSSSPDQCSLCTPGWGQGPASTGPGLCSRCPPTYYGPGGSDEPCVSCAAHETSPPGASDSSDCFDEMMPTSRCLCPQTLRPVHLPRWHCGTAVACMFMDQNQKTQKHAAHTVTALSGGSGMLVCVCVCCSPLRLHHHPHSCLGGSNQPCSRSRQAKHCPGLR